MQAQVHSASGVERGLGYNQLPPSPENWFTRVFQSERNIYLIPRCYSELEAEHDLVRPLLTFATVSGARASLLQYRNLRRGAPRDLPRDRAAQSGHGAGKCRKSAPQFPGMIGPFQSRGWNPVPVPTVPCFFSMITILDVSINIQGNLHWSS